MYQKVQLPLTVAAIAFVATLKVGPPVGGAMRAVQAPDVFPPSPPVPRTVLFPLCQATPP
jgi:hypothetical protein